MGAGTRAGCGDLVVTGSASGLDDGCEMLANQLSLPENRARETIGAAACSAGVRIVEDSLGVGAVPAVPGDCKAALFWAASYGNAIIANWCR